MSTAKNPEVRTEATKVPTMEVFRSEGKAPALTIQKKVDTYNFPFTCNPMIGCLFNCRYCYLRSFPFNQSATLGETMAYKAHFTKKLKAQLRKFRTLPLHLRRVQVGVASEVYHPRALKALKEDTSLDMSDVGLMSNVLKAFLAEQEAGYLWAISIVTKSPLIVQDIDLLKQFQCLQAEITITTLDEDLKKVWEDRTPSVKRRLELIEELSNASIFTRVMAMPMFVRPEEEAGCETIEELEAKRWSIAEAIWKACEARGAKGIKSKPLHYFDTRQLLEGPATRVKGKFSDPDKEFLIRSGEFVHDADGALVMVEMDSFYDKKTVKKHLPIKDYGYKTMPGLTDLDWGDVA